ncbi:unnamed protein product [marine sediment metagenome]|uniref:Uncharacterized protein n=1 Tax=marine sediment metagenome TaxID=412755 RepID=X1GY51_9ZZZZ
MPAAIAGPRTVEHVGSAIKGCELTLSDEDLRQIDRIVAAGRAASDFYDAVVYSRMRVAVNGGM